MRAQTYLNHLILIAGSLFMALPVLALLMSVTHPPAVIAKEGLQILPGTLGVKNLIEVAGASNVLGFGVSPMAMLANSMIIALGVATVKTVTSLLAVFALVYFRLPGRDWIFGALLLSMFFPVETRIIPTFLVARDLGLLNSYAGMILPIVASGLGVLIFRASFRQVPAELHEAARLDGAGPIRFLLDILLPLSMPMVAALFAMLFVLGWNQYVWPIMINTTSEDLYTIVRGIERAGRSSVTGMVLALMALIPPGIVMILAQRWIVRGLTMVSH